MTVFQKLQFLREERYQDLTPWEQSFIEEMYDGIDGLPSEVTDGEIEDYLTRRQIEKIEEIWSDLGL